MTIDLRIMLSLFLALLPTGCMGPALESLPPPAVPNQWYATKDTATVHVWLDDFDFNGFGLKELVNEALGHNHNLQQAAYRRTAAREKVAIAEASLWPTIKTNIDGRRARVVSAGRAATQTTYGLAGSVSWEADLWGRITAVKQASLAQALAVEADFKAAQLSLASDVLRNWFGVVETKQQLQLAELSLASYRQSLAIVEAQYRTGLGVALDLRMARTEVASAENILALRHREHESVIRGLEILLGRYPSGELTIAAELPLVLAQVPAGLPADLLARRPDLLAAEQRLTAAGELLEAARRNRLPSLNLSASLGNSSQELHNLLDWDALVWNLVGGLVQPVFQGGRLKAEEALARLERKEAWAAYAQVLLVAFREVETALVADVYLQNQQDAANRAAAEAAMAADLASSRYRNGLVTIMTLLESQRRAYTSKSTFLRVVRERLNNRIGLYLALGGDFQQQETEKTTRPVMKESHP